MKDYEWLEEFYLDKLDEDGNDQGEEEQSDLGQNEENDSQGEVEESDNESPTQGDNKDKSKKPKESIPEKAKNVKDAIDTGKKIGKLSKMLGPIMPVLGYIALIIAILIAAIGLLMFLLTMPGAILDKIKSLASDFGNALINLVVGEGNNVKQSQISDVATRLEDMGYDMYAYGFQSDKVKPEAGSNFWGSTVYHTKYLNHEVPTSDFFDSGYTPDMDTLRVTNDGILRDKNGVVYIESDYIRAYLVSDNYVYMIRNNNFNLINAFKSMLELKFFRTLFTGNFGDGLINLYHEGSALGTLGDNFGVLDSVGGFLRALFGGSRISISMDRPAKQMIVTTEVNGYYGVKRKFLYNLDGWTGRYGMPLEFLLSLHLSSMQPDLAYDLVTKTKTELQLVTHKSEATVKGGVKLEDGGIYDSESLEEMKKALIKEQEDARYQALMDAGYTGFTAFLSSIGDAIFGVEPYKTICQPYNDAIQAIKDKFDPLIAKAKKLNTKFDTFIPYIYQVKDHWFRDVYFTDNDVKTFIEIDEDYEKRTAERWTKYETVTVSESGVDTSDLDNTITYGEGGSQYVAERSEYTRGGLGDVQYVLYYYKGGDINNEVKYMYNGKPGTKEDAQNDTSLTQDEKNTLHKKSVTSSLDFKYYEDVDKDYDGMLTGVNDGRWVAYKIVENQDSGWQKYVPDNSGGSADNISESEAEDLYYKIILSSAVQQIEDGQRGATNTLAKQIFSVNKYYTYNGTADRAQAIDEDRYGSKVKSEYEKYKKGEETSFNTTSDPRNPDLIETFSVTRDSMSAFNILTNMNTLDSDAIYHDFKELIVELNFFDKEELTVVPNQSFEWPIPEVGSRGWPNREYSKYENEYGTSIHSKYLLRYFQLKDMIGMSFNTEAEEEEEPEEIGGSDDMVLADHDHLHTITELVKVQAQDTQFSAPFDDLEYSGSGDLTNVKGGPEVMPEQLTVEEYLETTEEMCNYINETGYDYCVNRPATKCEGKNGTKCTAECMAAAALPPPLGTRACSCACEVNHCNHTPLGNKCGLPNSFEASKQDPTSKQNMCCATLVSWSLINMKMMKPSDCQHGPKGVADYCLKVLGAEKIEPGNQLQPGDILIYERHSHVDLLGEQVSGGFKKYNGGHYVSPGAQPFGQHSSINLQPGDGWTSKSGQIVIYAVRLPWGNKNNTDAYKGYKGGELVVSPVTGIVIQAGTKQKITNIETGLTEYVGFVKMRVLNRTDFTKIFGKDGSSDDDLIGFKYFLEEYEDNKVAGDIMYIEGFHLELLDDNINLTSHSNVTNSKGEPINQYTQQEYKYVLNKRVRKKLEEKEKARIDAKSVYNTSLGLLIKEGTALGTTYSDGEYEVEYQKYLNELREEAGEETWPVSGKETIASDDPRKGREITVRPGLTGENGSENLYDHEDILKYKGDGNYIRMIMRASKDGFDAKVDKDSIIEDVEDYIEITPRPNNEIDWELFFWTPHESGPADPNGPIAYEDHPGASCVTAGMIQWMTAYADGGNHNIQYLCEHIAEYDSTIGNSLAFIKDWTNTQIKDDVKGDREIEKAMKSVNDKDHDQFMWAELEVAKAQYLEPLLKNHPWLEKRPKCVQGAIMHIAVHDGHYPSDMDTWDSLDDKGVLDKVAAHWNDGSWQYKEPGIAKAILDGKLSIDDVEYWVRNKDVQFLLDHGVDYYGHGEGQP